MMMMLHRFVAANREEIVRRCRSKVATRSPPIPIPPASDIVDTVLAAACERYSAVCVREP